MPAEKFQRLCLYNAESNAIVKAIEAAGNKSDLSKLKLYPSVVPERGVSQQTMDQAFAALQALVAKRKIRAQPPAPEPKAKKAWWKIW